MSVVDALPAGRGTVEFDVYGVPVPQGSKSAFVVKGRAVVAEQGRAKLNPWRHTIAAAAAERLAVPLPGALEVELLFTLSRPRAHYRTGRHAAELRADAPAYVAGRPDVDKLTRAVLDALTGVAFFDDGQVSSLLTTKVYGERAGVRVRLRELVG